MRSLFFLVLLLAGQTFAAGPENDPCYSQALPLLAKHGFEFHWLAQPQGYRAATKDFGTWAEIKLKKGQIQKLSFVSNQEISNFTFDAKCHSIENKTQIIKQTAKAAHFLNDNDLAKLMQQHDAGLIYSWSPGMEFSASYYQSFKKVATKMDLSFVPVVNPDMPITAIERLMEIYKIPDPIRQLNAVELFMRGAANHYPKSFLFAHGRVLDKVITGVMSEEQLTSEIQKALREPKTRGMASEPQASCIPARVAVAHHGIAEYVRAEPRGRYVMTCPENAMIFYDLENLDEAKFAKETQSKFHWETYPVVAKGEWILLVNHESLNGTDFVSSFYDFKTALKDPKNVKPLFSDSFESPYLTTATLSDEINSVTKKREVTFRSTILPDGAYRDYKATLDSDGAVVKVELARANQPANQILCGGSMNKLCLHAQPMISPDGGYYFFTCENDSYIYKVNQANPKNCELYKHWAFAGQKPTFSFPTTIQRSSRFLTFSNAGITKIHYPLSVYLLDLDKNPDKIEVLPGDFSMLSQEEESGDYPNFLADGRILFQHAIEGMSAARGASGEFITIDPNQVDGDTSQCIRK